MITTVNVQHLESLNDVVQRITGVPQRETVPDEVVRSADQIELVDMSPESLRRRLAHGNVYAAEKIDAALGNYFRVGNLTALRELALLWVADRVDEVLQRYREEHGIGRVWEARERVVVALPGDASGEALIRRAARIAARASGGELLAVHIARSDGLSGDVSPTALAAQRHLVETLGGTLSHHHRRRRLARADRVRAGQERDAARPRHIAAQPVQPLPDGPWHRRDDDDAVRRHRRAHGHARRAPPAGRGRNWLPPNPLRQAAWGSGVGWRGNRRGRSSPRRS